MHHIALIDAYRRSSDRFNGKIAPLPIIDIAHFLLFRHQMVHSYAEVTRLFVDGYHFSEEGNALVARELLVHLRDDPRTAARLQ